MSRSGSSPGCTAKPNWSASDCMARFSGMMMARTRDSFSVVPRRRAAARAPFRVPASATDRQRARRLRLRSPRDSPQPANRQNAMLARSWIVVVGDQRHFAVVVDEAFLEQPLVRHARDSIFPCGNSAGRRSDRKASREISPWAVRLPARIGRISTCVPSFIFHRPDILRSGYGRIAGRGSFSSAHVLAVQNHDARVERQIFRATRAAD